jgi:hypothetical protein
LPARVLSHKVVCSIGATKQFRNLSCQCTRSLRVSTETFPAIKLHEIRFSRSFHILLLQVLISYNFLNSYVRNNCMKCAHTINL